MDINKINAINATQQTGGVKRTNKPTEVTPEQKDSVSFSDQSKTKVLFNKAMEIVNNAPDVRVDKVEEARNLLESYKNPSDSILQEVSQKILREFGEIDFTPQS